jgi:hypothetical protein
MPLIRTKEGVLKLDGALENVWHLVAFCTVLVDGVEAMLEGEDPLLKHVYEVQGSVPDADKSALMLKLEQKLKQKYKTPDKIPDRLLRVLGDITLDFSTYSATYKRIKRGGKRSPSRK